MINPIVTVIIPTYNGSRWLPEAISSVRSQSFQDYEIIIVDDGSTESIATQIPDDPRIIYVHQENSGTSNARNRGLQMARGEYIAFLDHDDKWKENKLEKQVNLIKRHEEIGLLFCDYESFSSNPKRPNGFSRGTISKISSTALKPEGFIIDSPDVFSLLLIDLFVQIPSTWMIRRKTIEGVNGFEPLLRRGGEDLNLALRLAERCRFGFHNEALTIRREFPESLSAKNIWEDEMLLALNLLLENGNLSTHSRKLTFDTRRKLARNLARIDIKHKNYKAAIMKLKTALEGAKFFDGSTVKDIYYLYYSKIKSYTKK